MYAKRSNDWEVIFPANTPKTNIIKEAATIIPKKPRMKAKGNTRKKNMARITLPGANFKNFLNSSFGSGLWLIK